MLTRLRFLVKTFTSETSAFFFVLLNSQPVSSTLDPLLIRQRTCDTCRLVRNIVVWSVTCCSIQTLDVLKTTSAASTRDLRVYVLGRKSSKGIGLCTGFGGCPIAPFSLFCNWGTVENILYILKGVGGCMGAYKQKKKPKNGGICCNRALTWVTLHAVAHYAVHTVLGAELVLLTPFSYRTALHSHCRAVHFFHYRIHSSPLFPAPFLCCLTLSWMNCSQLCCITCFFLVGGTNSIKKKKKIYTGLSHRKYFYFSFPLDVGLGVWLKSFSGSFIKQFTSIVKNMKHVALMWKHLTSKGECFVLWFSRITLTALNPRHHVHTQALSLLKSRPMQGNVQISRWAPCISANMLE